VKKLFGTISMLLALNFLALAGGVGWLWKTGQLDKEKAQAIREVIFPKPEPDVPATQPVAESELPPALRLDELLAKASGRTAGEQVEFIRHSFDAQMAQLDRRHRDLTDLKAQVDLASSQLAKDRAALEEAQKQLTQRQQQATKLASDKGFQDSLLLYNSMPARQVKTVFMTLNEDTVQQYLQAMQPRTATKIIKEFKTPEELERIQKVLEKMRKAEVTLKE
jgi:hypothetical protein